ncbi:MAG: hypothetical protein QM638_12210 [Nocardioides sp.]|uniref:DAPG hydrolase family protein n=1 Tax=Nocardioides sp. TaxID=35761 RepID=UPI0039E2ED2B
MKLSDVDQLLDPFPLALETGVERGDDGVLHVACRTDMHHCRGEMFEWWFRSRPDTERYRWWHPIDHVSSEWTGDLRADTHVGSIHVVQERLTDLPTADLLIQFRDPSEFFDDSLYQQATKTGAITATVVGRTGIGFDAPRDADGRIQGGRLLHLGRDTEWGLAMRSHFYFGVDLAAGGASAEEVTEQTPEVLGFNLLQHCYNEFTFLSRFLPGLFAGAHPDHPSVVTPW